MKVNHMEVLQMMNDAASDQGIESLVLTQPRRDALRAAVELICGLEVDNTSDDGNGHFNLMGSQEWSLLSDFGFETPGYPKEPEPLHEVITLPGGQREALTMQDILAGKYFDRIDGRVKILPQQVLNARLNDFQRKYGMIRDVQENDHAE